MLLITSNENKLKEFKRFGIENLGIEKGRDLEEVKADPITVIIHKAIAAGNQRMVEDTSLHVEGEDVGTDVRWLLESIADCQGKKAQWEVLLGENKDGYITVYRGVIDGEITAKYKGQAVGFGFDAYFKPEGREETLYDLELKGEKDTFSARKKAVEQMIGDLFYKKIKIEDVPKWTGEYQ